MEKRNYKERKLIENREVCICCKTNIKKSRLPQTKYCKNCSKYIQNNRYKKKRKK